MLTKYGWHDFIALVHLCRRYWGDTRVPPHPWKSFKSAWI